jgi:hypothetical protein
MIYLNKYLEEMRASCKINKFRDGSFEFEIKTDKRLLSEVINENIEKPPVAGIYVICGLIEGSLEGSPDKELLYIGKSGTIKNNGTLCEQSIAKRLTNVREKKDDKKIYGNEYFIEVIKGNKGVGPYRALRFDWIETYRGNIGIPPFLAEAQLLAAYLKDNGKLPPLNKSA